MTLFKNKNKNYLHYSYKESIYIHAIYKLRYEKNDYTFRRSRCHHHHHHPPSNHQRHHYRHH